MKQHASRPRESTCAAEGGPPRLQPSRARRTEPARRLQGRCCRGLAAHGAPRRHMHSPSRWQSWSSGRGTGTTAEARGRAHSKCLNRVTRLNTELSPPCRALEESSQPTSGAASSLRLVRTFRELAGCHPPRPGVSCCPGRGLPWRAVVCTFSRPALFLSLRSISLQSQRGTRACRLCGIGLASCLSFGLCGLVSVIEAGSSHASAQSSLAAVPVTGTSHFLRLPLASRRLCSRLRFPPSFFILSLLICKGPFTVTPAHGAQPSKQLAAAPPALILLSPSRACPPPQQPHLLCHNISFSDQSREHADHTAVAPRPLPRGPAPSASPGLESAVSSHCLPSRQHVSRLFKTGPDIPGNMRPSGVLTPRPPTAGAA